MSEDEDVEKCVVANGDEAEVNIKDGKDGKKKKKKKEPAQTVSFADYYRYATGLDWFFITIAVFFSMAKGFSWPAVMIIFGGMIKSLTDPNIDPLSVDMSGEMKKFAYYYVGVGAANILTGYFGTAFMDLAAERMAHKIRISYFRAIMRQEIGWFDKTSSGALTTRLTGDIAKIKSGFSSKVGMAIQWLTAFLAGFVIAFIYEWRLSLVIMSTSPLLAIGGAAFSKVMVSFSSAQQKAYAEAGGLAEEIIGAIRTVIAFGGEKHEASRFNEKLDDSEKAGNRNGLFSGLSMGFTMFIMFGTYGLAFWYGAKLIGDEKATIEDVMVSFFNVLIGSFAMGHASPHITTMNAGRGAAYEVFKTIDRESEIDYEKEDGKELSPGYTAKVEFKDVDFVYPSRDDVQIMKGFNLVLEPGKTHALVGPSGCGKSTAVALIERFYDAKGGQVCLDGEDVKGLNLKWLREQIGLVGQEPVLFSTTIEENIRFGREDVTKEEIVAACKKAFAHKFISDLPDGYNTLCGERGAKLSGGQKQRVAIARALVRNPKILLLDEATSALDNQSEGIVQQALEEASKGRTTLVIAHRLSTIINADKISVIGDHKIQEEGTHTELLAKEGLYHMLVTYQQNVQDGDEDAVGDLPTYDEVMEASSTKTPLDRQVSKDSIRRRRLTSQKSYVSATSDKQDMVDVDLEDGKDKKKKPEAEASFFEIMSYHNAYEIVAMIIGCIGAAINGAAMPVFAVLFANVITDLAALAVPPTDPNVPKDYSNTNRWALYFALLGVAMLVANVVQIYFMTLLGSSFTRRLRYKSFRALLRNNLEFFDRPENSIGALTTRLNDDAAAVSGATGVRIGTFIQNAVSLGVGIGIAFSASWKLTLLTLACIPFVAIAGSVQMLQLTGDTKSQQYEDSGKIAAESIENMRTVVSLSLEKNRIANYILALKKPYKSQTRHVHLFGISMGFGEAVIMFTYAAVFTYGAHLMDKKEVDFNDVLKVFSSVIFGAMTIGQTMSMLPDYGKAKASAFNIFSLITSEPKIDAYSDKGQKPAVEGTVEFRNVKFNYPTRPELAVLQGLSFKAMKGQTVALVGQSGCGKSTSVQLTERFYDVLGGSVNIDGVDVKSINVAYLRQQMGLVSQEPILFDYSIRDNIKYGALHREVSDDEVKEAAKSANIHNFITELPEGYNTRVGEKGTQLSGGQKQRIAIARALVRNPKILLLDEATSALDTESEKIVQEALDKAREGRTCLVIAHRLSTIHNSDLICVIQEGAVIEQGTHSELMSMRGVYYGLNKSNSSK